MKTYELKKINVLPFATATAVMVGVVGIVEGAILFLASLGSEVQTSNFLLIIYPVVFQIMGFIFGALQAALLNLVSKHIVRIKFTLSEQPDLAEVLTKKFINSDS